MPSSSPASPGKHYRVIPLFITLAPWTLSSANEEGRTVFLQHYRTIALHSPAFYLSAVMSNIFMQTLLKMPLIARITEAESDSTALLFSTHWLLHAITAFRTFLSLYAGDFVTNCPLSPSFVSFSAFSVCRCAFIFFVWLYTHTDVWCACCHFPNSCMSGKLICLPGTILFFST